MALVLLLAGCGCLVAARACLGRALCCGHAVSPLWGVEAAGEGLHAQDAEDDEGHDADGSVDAECRGQRLAGDSCCTGGAAAAGQQKRVRAAGNIATPPGWHWLLAEAATRYAGWCGCTLYRRLARKPPNNPGQLDGVSCTHPWLTDAAADAASGWDQLRGSPRARFSRNERLRGPVFDFCARSR